jgi:hypothetical protein
MEGGQAGLARYHWKCTTLAVDSAWPSVFMPFRNA